MTCSFKVLGSRVRTSIAVAVSHKTVGGKSIVNTFVEDSAAVDNPLVCSYCGRIMLVSVPTLY